MDPKIVDDERKAFRLRLASALVAIGCAPSPTALAREFNPRADGAAVTVHGARKWLKGEAFPTQARIHVLARWLHVSPEWLRFGDGAKNRTESANDENPRPHDDALLLERFQQLDRSSRDVVHDLILSLLKHHSLCSATQDWGRQDAE